MSDLTDFLLARIAEDEERAEFVRRQNEGPWHRPFETWKLSWHDEYDLLCIEPERALAECEAKRRIVEALVDAEAAVATYNNDDPSNPPSYWQEWGNLHALRLAAELLASPYADYPDYREEWKP